MTQTRKTRRTTRIVPLTPKEARPEREKIPVEFTAGLSKDEWDERMSIYCPWPDDSFMRFKRFLRVDTQFAITAEAAHIRQQRPAADETLSGRIAQVVATITDWGGLFFARANPHLVAEWVKDTDTGDLLYGDDEGRPVPKDTPGAMPIPTFPLLPPTAERVMGLRSVDFLVAFEFTQLLYQINRKPPLPLLLRAVLGQVEDVEVKRLIQAALHRSEHPEEPIAEVLTADGDPAAGQALPAGSEWSRSEEGEDGEWGDEEEPGRSGDSFPRQNAHMG